MVRGQQTDCALRILAIAHSYPLFPGDGTAPFIASIVEGLADRGHSLDVLLPAHPRFQQPGGDGIRFIPYRYSPVERWAPWGYGAALTGASRLNSQAVLALPIALASLRRRLAALLSEEQYDVVHAHWLVPNAWAALAPAARRSLPLVVSLHGSDITIAERMALLRPLWRRVLAGSSAVTAPSNDIRLRALRLGADPDNAVTIHYGVDTTLFAPRQIQEEIRASLGAPSDAFLVVSVGRLVEKKGFRYLIEACSRLRGTHLAIIGEGNLRPELEQVVLGTGASVTFTGELGRSAVAEAVGVADVFAVPSVVDSAGNVDGLPNTLLEALAAGRPVVASAVAGIPEVIQDSTNGLLVPEKDTAALTQALDTLRRDHELRDRLGREAMERARTQLSWSTAVEAFEDVLRGAANR